MNKSSTHSKEAASANRSIADFLAQSSAVRRYCQLFYRATGLQVMLLPAAGSGDYQILAGPRHSICKWLLRNRVGQAVCQKFARTLPAGHHPIHPQKCFAGFTTLAVPIIIHQQPVAHLMCGQVFCQPPTKQDFNRAWSQLRRLGLPVARPQITQVFFQTRVVRPDQMEAAVELLEQMAHRLTGTIQEWVAQSPVRGEPICVQKAKALVESRLAEKFTTRQAALATHVSSQYFCRAFKTATGKTFTAYASGRRIDQAKQLLGNPTNRILDVGLAVGFGSASRFAQVFKRYTGMTALAYRQAVALGENR